MKYLSAVLRYLRQNDFKNVDDTAVEVSEIFESDLAQTIHDFKASIRKLKTDFFRVNRITRDRFSEEVYPILQQVTKTGKLRKPDVRTGFDWGDEALNGVLRSVRRYHEPDSNSIEILCRILNYMGQNLVENFFKGAEFNEKDFQYDITRFLRSFLGQQVIKEVYSGGGRVDLLIKNVPVELKVEKETVDVERVVLKHLGQAGQYIASVGAKIGILCILDLVRREKPIPDPRNDILVKIVPVHGFKKSKLPTKTVAISVIIRGNLIAPSRIKCTLK